MILIHYVLEPYIVPYTRVCKCFHYSALFCVVTAARALSLTSSHVFPHVWRIESLSGERESESAEDEVNCLRSLRGQVAEVLGF